MMRPDTNRRGSALLIVLGMMSFIVVSAVAFSAYMRYARLPSSYLRRTSSVRLLAKAAVAEAVEALDCAIGNNPYPGIGNAAYAYPRGENAGETKERNYWRDRIFIGHSTPVSPDDTVSTLCLEGLAYIPAPYVNEARYWSRRSSAGQWKTMAFDAGRYAFCAINVSDCFDINRMVAEAGRDSSDTRRVSLAHCFENSSHNDYEVDPKAWDGFMKDYRDKNHTKVPLVSVADLNLALWNKKPGGLESPFCQYLQQSSNATFVKDENDELQKAMAFVTDSLYPMTNRVASAIDLSREKDQPLYGMAAGKASADKETKNEDEIDDVIENTSNNFFKRYAANLRIPELVQLYDYLDRDSVPLSLALPTVERTPMITGVAVDGRLRVSVVKASPVICADPNAQIDPNSSSQEPLTKLRVTTGELRVDCSELMASAGFVYPFKYKRGSVPQFKAQAAATITFVKAGDEKALRRQQAKAPAVLLRQGWNNSQKAIAAEKFGGEKTPVVATMQSEAKAVKMPSKAVTDEEDAVLDDVVFEFDGQVAFASEFKEPPLALDNGSIAKAGTFRLIERVNAKNTDQVVEVVESLANILPANSALSGVVGEDEFKQNEYVPVLQLWVRIVDKNNKVVDLVPACVADDESVSEFVGDFSGSGPRPVLRFSGDAGEAFRLTADVKTMLDAGARDMTLKPKAYIADDPRFNYAPENLVAVENPGGTFKATWLNTYQHSGERDGDIFMMTSDAGYLQSPYELTALLDVTGSLKSGGERTDTVEGGHFNGTARTDWGSLAANRSMWRTYSQYPNGARSGDIAHLDIANGTKGFRVNPYTEDVNILMAALANTPFDWWAASTNFVNDAEKKAWSTKSSLTGEEVIDLDEANDHAFSEMGSSPVKVKHGKFTNGTAQSNTLTELAQKLQSQLRGSANWETAFDTFGWNQDDRIGGVSLGVPLHSVDRKFLHGFWRECFGNRQQLFLVFVRAEPMMMGGGAMGQTPPQLGARAVALVWRDPNATQTDNNGQPRPHRTRVLFYRQFD